MQGLEYMPWSSLTIALGRVDYISHLRYPCQRIQPHCHPNQDEDGAMIVQWKYCECYRYRNEREVMQGRNRDGIWP
jgi:hypothetical protein